MNKIGILGGTFDPIHKGHIKMAQLAKETLNLDQIILLPCGIPSHKAAARSEKEHRLEMCRLAAEQYGFEVSDYEIAKDEPSYTVNSIEHFRQIYPVSHIVFILGGDSLDYIEQWYNAEKLLTLCEIFTVNRRSIPIDKLNETARMLTEKYGAVIHICQNDYIDISSTQVREAVSMGIYIPSLLPLPVIDYIKMNRLYRVKM